MNLVAADELARIEGEHGSSAQEQAELVEAIARLRGSIGSLNREGRERLGQDLLRALEEGYVRDYEELIPKYFEALDAALPAGRKNP